MPRDFRGSMAMFSPAPVVERVPFEETSAQAGVSREQLWKVVKAARAFHRAATAGRLNSDQFYRLSGLLERGLDDLPAGVCV